MTARWANTTRRRWRAFDPMAFSSTTALLRKVSMINWRCRFEGSPAAAADVRYIADRKRPPLTVVLQYQPTLGVNVVAQPDQRRPVRQVYPNLLTQGDA